MSQGALTPREIEVLIWISRGKTSYEVAKILEIAESTVIYHLENVKRNLNASNRTHAVAIAIHKQLLGKEGSL